MPLPFTEWLPMPATACRILFWTSAGLLAYTFLGYGVLIRCLARFRGRGAAVPEAPAERVAVVIVAHNEEARIRARIENLLSRRCPSRVAVCSDGSTDATASEARLAGARVFEFPLRRGKAACLSDAIPALALRSSSLPIPASNSPASPSRGLSGTLPIPRSAPSAASSASAMPGRAREPG